jgi:hypothetical protein
LKGDYPHFKALYAHEELAEHFLLTPPERLLISQLRGDLNRQGAAVLLKSNAAIQLLSTIQTNPFFPRSSSLSGGQHAQLSQISLSLFQVTKRNTT